MVKAVFALLFSVIFTTLIIIFHIPSYSNPVIKNPQKVDAVIQVNGLVEGSGGGFIYYILWKVREYTGIRSDIIYTYLAHNPVWYTHENLIAFTYTIDGENYHEASRNNKEQYWYYHKRSFSSVPPTNYKDFIERYPKGSKIEIIYSKNNPENSYIHQPTHILSSHISFICIFLNFIAHSLVGYFIFKLISKHQSSEEKVT
jgi:hypothetical protein